MWCAGHGPAGGALVQQTSDTYQLEMKQGVRGVREAGQSRARRESIPSTSLNEGSSVRSGLLLAAGLRRWEQEGVAEGGARQGLEARARERCCGSI